MTATAVPRESNRKRRSIWQAQLIHTLAYRLIHLARWFVAVDARCSISGRHRSCPISLPPLMTSLKNAWPFLNQGNSHPEMPFIRQNVFVNCR